MKLNTYLLIVLFFYTGFAKSQSVEKATLGLNNLEVWDYQGKKFKFEQILKKNKLNFIFLTYKHSNTNPNYSHFIFQNKYPFKELSDGFNDIGYIKLDINNEKIAYENNLIPDSNRPLKSVNSNYHFLDTSLQKIKIIIDLNPLDIIENRLFLIVNDNGDIIHQSFGNYFNPLQYYLNALKPFSSKNSLPIFSKGIHRPLLTSSYTGKYIDCILSFDNKNHDSKLKSNQKYGSFLHYGIVRLPSDLYLFEGGGTRITPSIFNLHGNEIKLCKKAQESKENLGKITEYITINGTFNNWKNEGVYLGEPVDLYEDFAFFSQNQLENKFNKYFNTIKQNIIQQGGVVSENHKVEKVKIKNEYLLFYTYRYTINNTNYEEQAYEFGRKYIESSIKFTYPLEKKGYWENEIRNIIENFVLVEIE